MSDVQNLGTPRPKPTRNHKGVNTINAPIGGSAVIVSPASCAVGECSVIERNGVRTNFHRMAEHGPYAIQVIKQE